MSCFYYFPFIFLLWCSFLATKPITTVRQWYLFTKGNNFFSVKKKKQSNGFPSKSFSKIVAAAPLFSFRNILSLITTILFFRKIINNAIKEEKMCCSSEPRKDNDDKVSDCALNHQVTVVTMTIQKRLLALKMIEMAVKFMHLKHLENRSL